MTILEQIIQHKRTEVAQRKELYPTKLLEKSIYFSSPTVSLKQYLVREDKIGIIAEIKRRSPSLGMINAYVDVERTSIGYMQAGASAISVLTDQAFFAGKNSDLTTARKFNYCPILRKDFTIDEYQIIEAKSIGADAILLLANVITIDECREFTKLAHSLGLEVLLETHTEEELEYYQTETDVIGINNRNLKTFEVNLEHSIKLANSLPKGAVKVSESGIKCAEDLVYLKKSGFQGFLMGERFMKHTRPEKACLQFIEETKLLMNNKQLG